VCEIGINPFEYAGLTDIWVSPDSEYLAVIDGVLFSKADMRLVSYPMAKTDSSYTMPNGVRSIGD